MTGGGAQAWLPYCGAAPGPGELLAQWNFDPLVLVALLLAGLGWRVAVAPTDGVRDKVNLAGLGVLAILFVSPFCALTSSLFAARTAHHVILVAVAAPLFAWSLPPAALRRRFPLALCTGLATAVLWAWHVPSLYAAALSHDGIYWLMQASLLASAIAFWSAIRHAEIPAAVAALLATMVQMGLLGALLTFAGRALYAPHFLTTAAWGYSPLQDQQLGGLIMWAPAAALYLFAALFLAGRWLHREGRAAA